MLYPDFAFYTCGTACIELTGCATNRKNGKCTASYFGGGVYLLWIFDVETVVHATNTIYTFAANENKQRNNTAQKNR